MKKAFAIIILLLCVFILYSALASENENNKESENFLILCSDLRGYSSFLWFHNHIGQWQTDSMFRARGYTHLVFVRYEEEFLKHDLPEYVVVAWPSLYTHLMLYEINSFIRENEECDNLWLAYPVTIEDMLDNWENVWNFLREMRGAGTTSRFNRIAPSVREEYSRIINAELEMLNEAIKATTIDVTLYDLESPFTWNDLRHPRETILAFEVYAQLDEDVRMQLVMPNVYAEFRAVRRLLEWENKHFPTTIPRDQRNFPENYTGRIRAWEFN